LGAPEAQDIVIGCSNALRLLGQAQVPAVKSRGAG
jgi:hypothetical protein